MNQSINTDSKNSKEPQQKYRLGRFSMRRGKITTRSLFLGVKCKYLRWVLELFGGFGFYGPLRLFHSFWAESILRWGKNERSPRKTTWPPASRTWLVSHVTRARLRWVLVWAGKNDCGKVVTLLLYWPTLMVNIWQTTKLIFISAVFNFFWNGMYMGYFFQILLATRVRCQYPEGKTCLQEHCIKFSFSNITVETIDRSGNRIRKFPLKPILLTYMYMHIHNLQTIPKNSCLLGNKSIFTHIPRLQTIPRIQCIPIHVFTHNNSLKTI